MFKKSKQEESAINGALSILEKHMRYNAIQMSEPKAVVDYLKLRFAGLGHEEFHVVFLDAQNKVIVTESMFRGTLTATSVYPREVVKKALEFNAAAVILAHNHPSGNATASQADIDLTRKLREGGRLLEIQVLDHLIVAGQKYLSFADEGLL